MGGPEPDFKKSVDMEVVDLRSESGDVETEKVSSGESDDDGMQGAEARVE